MTNKKRGIDMKENKSKHKKTEIKKEKKNNVKKQTNNTSY